METKIFKLDINNKNLVVQAGDLAEQANGSVLVRYGDTEVLATAVMSKYEKEGIDFFPLTVDYEERYYAAGKILGSRYIRRESRPSEEAILTARLIDRAIRPRFPKNLRREVQIVITCLSWDGENDPDILGLIGASTALSISDIPWQGPVAVLRVGQNKESGEFVLNPSYEQREKSDLDLVLAGITEGDDVLINMIESEAKEVCEEMILKAVQFAKPEFKKIIDFQKEIVKTIGKQKIALVEPVKDIDFESKIREFLGDKLEKALFNRNPERMDEVNQLKDDLADFVETEYPEEEKKRAALEFFESEIERLIHKRIVESEQRPDGRKLDEIRELDAKVGLLPRTHGSGLFIRGQTKSLSILTLGAPGDQKLLEGMEIIGKKRFIHHYNFPPYSVGEARPIRGPSRRDIGHGMLAEKALISLVPSFEDFPYTIRIVSEILSSNGSTSMASVSSSSLALMDAGVPIKRPAAGIAMGLMVENKEQGLIGDNYKILTDIQGPEDHHGDMDFKVAGTKKGITAIQMDVKISGITEKIIKETLERAKKARFQILDLMEKVIAKPRTQLSPYAPRILTIQIKPEKIREVIGPNGRVINEIIAECGVEIDIEESGRIFITSDSEESAQKAAEWIKNITREVKVGEIFQAKIKRILDFGAFAEILPGQEGLIHISELAPYHVKRVEDVVKVGDVVSAKVISIDEQGRINLSMKAVKRGRR